VVVAYRRRRFLEEAVGSVADPAFTGRVELLVATDLRDPGLDDALGARGAKRLEVDGTAQGSWIVAAARRAAAPLLLFLDDDDRFVPGKLARARDLFRAHPDLVYWHHGQRFVRDGGAAAAPAPPRGPAEPRMSGAGPSSAFVADAWRDGAAFNLSSVAVRRDLVLAEAAWLAEVQGGAASALFVAASLSRGRMAYEPTPWTEFRLHDANTSGTGAPSRRRRWARRAALAPTLVHDAELLMARVRAMADDPERLRPLAFARAWNRLLVALAAPDGARAPRAAALRELNRASVGMPGRAARPYRWLGRAGWVAPRTVARWLRPPDLGTG